jgi:pimeloyl-ACP methyl ester carboxylesterase
VLARGCVILLNSGRDSHVGWGRGTVDLARDLAAHGYATLRFDLTAIGDSQPDTSGRRAELYAPSGASGLRDVAAAIELMTERGHERLALFGGCSGAYLAFVAGLRDPRIEAVIVRNIQRYIWRIDDRILFPIDEWKASVGGAASDAVHSAKGTQFAKIGFNLASHGLQRGSRLLSRLLLHRSRLRRRISAFNARGGRLLAVYSTGDIGLPHFNELLGRNGEGLLQGGGNAVHFVEGADHNFSSAAHRREFLAAVLAFLDRRQAGPRAEGLADAAQ